MSKTLLISVGGAPEPVIFSIRKNQAKKVIFFVSSSSRPMVTSIILPALLQDPGHILDHEFVVTPNEQDLGESAFTLLREVPAAFQRLGGTDLQWPDLVDYTAGTKAMSAALVLASSQYPCLVSYIGAGGTSDRTKAGLGTVIGGREVVFRRENPWNKIAWLDARSAAGLFNRGQYGNAARLMSQVSQRVDEEQTRRLYEVLAEVFKGFHQWDVFDHKNALYHLQKSTFPLIDLAEGGHLVVKDFKAFAEKTRESLNILKAIKPGQRSWEMVHDLLANALRRARLEQKYEDATARCYAAIEKGAQHCLFYAYGISSEGASPEQIPERLRQDFVVSCQSKTHSKGQLEPPFLQFGLARCLDLLVELDDPMGRRFQLRANQIQSHLAQRNHSILAHGIQPIEEKHFRLLFEDALELIGIQEDDLWSFPQLQM